MNPLLKLGCLTFSTLKIMYGNNVKDKDKVAKVSNSGFKLSVPIGK